MRLELLANEILLDLFEYLNTSDLFHAFHNLNYRFKQLLRTHIRFHSLDFRSISKDYFDMICEQYLPSTINQITSFCLSDGAETPGQAKLFLSHYFILNQFQQLESLTLDAIQSWKILNAIILQCHDLQYLTHLNIIDNDYKNQTNLNSIDNDYKNQTDSLFNHIWSLPKLTHCYFSGFYERNSSSNIISVNSSSIQYFSIYNLVLYSETLFSIFEHTPHLRYLSIGGNISEPENESLPVMASSLETFEYFSLRDEQWMISLLQNMPNLRNLKLEIFEIYWNGYDWEKFLTNHLPNIKLFRFKMSFEFPDHINIENEIDELLESFRTPFWLQKHRWFVRCHWFPYRRSMQNLLYNIIYTLPYVFKEYFHSNKYCVKSTCPNEEDYYTYNYVQTITYEYVRLYVDEVIPPFQFSNLRQCSINLFLNDSFHTYNPSLNRLTTLFITQSITSFGYENLQILVQKAPQLSSLICDYSLIVHTEILQLTNTSIRLLDFRYSSTSSNRAYFNHRDCVDLVNSSLGHQCEFLLIDVENGANVLYLINNMSNLRSLTVRCRYGLHLKDSRTLYEWLYDNLPSTYIITKSLYFPTDYVRLWIPSLKQKFKKRRSLWRIFRNWCSLVS